jgi:hypothetical protein
MKPSSFFVAPLLVCCLLGASPAPQMRIDKVYLLQSGDIILNGKRTTVAAFKKELQALRTAGGVVWYARENSQQPPTEKQFSIFKMLPESGVSIRLYTDGTFTTIVGP